MLTSLGHEKSASISACASHGIIQLLRCGIGANDGNLLDLFPNGSALQCENHIGRPFKIADVLLPAHPAPAMLQTRKLLPHFSAAAWAGFIAGSHPHPPCSTIVILDCVTGQTLKPILMLRRNKEPVKAVSVRIEVSADRLGNALHI